MYILYYCTFLLQRMGIKVACFEDFISSLNYQNYLLKKDQRLTSSKLTTESVNHDIAMYVAISAIKQIHKINSYF